MTVADLRADKTGAHRAAFAKNRKRILATENTCGICGKQVDMGLKYGEPLAPCIDHIIPINKGGHPSAVDNLQLAHWTCNRQKSDKLFKNKVDNTPMVLGNRNLPQSMAWVKYKSNTCV